MKPMTVALRQAQNFNEYTLEKLYGILKNYELEIQQDEELEKSSKKEKTVALVADKDEEEEKALKSTVVGRASSSINVCEAKNEAWKNKGKAIEENDESSTQEQLDDIDEHLAFPARKFSKLKFKRNAANSILFKRGSQSKPSSLVDRSKFE